MSKFIRPHYGSIFIILFVAANSSLPLLAVLRDMAGDGATALFLGIGGPGVDAQGNLYVGDIFNTPIRKITFQQNTLIILTPDQGYNEYV
jgi:hypothetical protein